MKPETPKQIAARWLREMKEAEKMYFKLVKMGMSADQAIQQVWPESENAFEIEVTRKTETFPLPSARS